MSRKPTLKPDDVAAPPVDAAKTPEPEADTGTQVASVPEADPAQTGDSLPEPVAGTHGAGELPGEGQPSPADPSPKLDPGDDALERTWTLTVKGPAKGRWRAGRKFGPEPVQIPVGDLTATQIEALMRDPELTVIAF